ncbi:glycosyltransferase family 2 protein [Vibrio parahaemolyticus]|nr:glycosyltransferase family 2 protein [Vibrio parahaemolyticus]
MESNFLPISVVIPCYNCSSTIERAVKSISKQTRLPYEVILVDDKSSDKTVPCLEYLKDKYSSLRIKIIELNKNSGPGTARNVGWNSSSQKFIAFLDSDDSWHKSKLEIQYKVMVENKDIYFSCHGSELFEDAHRGNTKKNQLKIVELTPKSMFVSNKVCTRSVMVVNDDRFRFKEKKKYSEDFLLWMEIILNKKQAVFIDATLAFSYKSPFGEGGLTGDLWKMQKGQFETYDILREKALISSTFIKFIKTYAFCRYLRRVLISKFSL